MYKKIKPEVIVLTEKTFKGKKDPEAVYNVVEVGIKIDDSDKDMGGKYINKVIWDESEKFAKDKNNLRKAKELAEDFKRYNEGKEIYVEIEEEKYMSGSGEEKTKYTFKKLGKTAIELLTKAGVLK